LTRNRRIYLDNAATTRPAPEVVEAMMPWLGEEYGNPATLYTPGREAEEAVQSAREAVAALLHADSPGEIFFTSGGTESDNWALFGSAFAGEKRHIITSAVEHHAVLETCEHLERLGAGISVTVLPVDARGRIAPKDLESAIRDDTALVSIMHANNEIGTVQPIAELADTAHARGVPFHTDAVQTVGKMDVDVRALGADMLSLSAHKFHGPKGVGALYIRKGTRLLPFIRGGGQEKFRRAGTTNVPGVVGLGRAARLAENTDFAAEGRRLSALREKLWTGLTDSIPQLTRNGDPGATLPGMLNITFAGIEGDRKSVV
jgi:cysteine desulfurase